VKLHKFTARVCVLEVDAISVTVIGKLSNLNKGAIEMIRFLASGDVALSLFCQYNLCRLVETIRLVSLS
jgi:hypothetical protein